jgi:[ribosomal protein S5]-alanine N-acetyltransferase
VSLLRSELELLGRRVKLRPLNPGDFGDYREVRRRCRTWLEPWEPLPAPGQPDPGAERRAFTALCGARDRERQLGTGYGFGLFVPADPYAEATDAHRSNRLAGVVNLSGIQRGPFQNSYLGYWIDQACAGRNYIPEAVVMVLRFAFEEADLHRVQVAIIPRNHASRRVVEKLGLREEGIAEKYLQIAGVWEDHVRYAMTAEDWAERGEQLTKEWLA